AGFLGQSTANRLVCQRSHGARIRPDEPDIAALAHFREMRVLGQKAVARVDRVHIRHFRSRDDPVDTEIAFARLRFANADRFIASMMHTTVSGFTSAPTST